MSTFTPGHWTVRDIPTQHGRYIDIGPSQDGGAPSVAFVLSRVNVSDAQLEADARLIAAAPELLAALEACERRLTHLAQNSVPAIYELLNARSAIAKATGPRFANVSCSQCGQSFGPGDNGYSHCENHATKRSVA